LENGNWKIEIGKWTKKIGNWNMIMEWDWNGIGMGLEWDRNGIGTGWKRDGNRMETELDWDKNGSELDGNTIYHHFGLCIVLILNQNPCSWYEPCPCL
jgi:hypothetical protein